MRWTVLADRRMLLTAKDVRLNPYIPRSAFMSLEISVAQYVASSRGKSPISERSSFIKGRKRLKVVSRIPCGVPRGYSLQYALVIVHMKHDNMGHGCVLKLEHLGQLTVPHLVLMIC